jgi:hypothetical protein
MKLSDPYVPDRSLLLAIALLGIGGLFAGGGLYVVSGLMGGPSGSGGAIGGGAVAGGGPVRPAPGSPGPRASGGPSAPLAGGGVPGWAQTRSSSSSAAASSAPAPSSSAPPSFVSPDVDLGHADLGTPKAGGTVSGAGGAPSSGRSSLAGSLPTGSQGSASSRPRSSSASGGQTWLSETSELSGNLRALSRALATRERNGENDRGRPTSDRTEESADRSGNGEASTSSGPPGPGDDPDNVPLGGAEWLAAAGAAYAVRRLQKRGIAESEDDDA